MKRIILAALLAALLGIYTRAAAAPETETLTLPGLKAPVTVKVNSYGIPAVYAGSIHDAVYIQGWLHARDRLWQMDLTRRQVMGRQAEIFGERSIDGDVQAYLARFPQVSKLVWEHCIPVECETFQAYSDGVNAYINSLKEPPPEYKKLGIMPDPWSPVDSIAIGRGVSWALSSDVGLEVALGVLSKLIGPKQLMEILPVNGVDPISILGNDEFTSFNPDHMSTDMLALLDSRIFKMGRNEPGSMRGSNNWVVSGSRTKDGHPILSNDTHMGLGSPCDWYELMIKTPEVHVTGLSFPGDPGFLVGHNDFVSWGETTARYDVSDIYTLRLDAKSNGKNYFYKGKSVPFEIEKVQIKYKTDKGMETREREVLNSVYGPVVYEKERPVSVMAFRWTGHEESHEDLAFLGFMTAKNLDDFKAALDHFEVGAQNFVYADINGNIYYRSQGKVPIRDGKPWLPLDGSSGKYEWRGYVPYNELPHLENPPRGYAATANNRQASPNFKHYLAALYDKGFRARRITDMIEATGKMTFDGMQKIQADVYSLAAERMLPILFAAAEKNKTIITPEAAAALKLLQSWDRYDRTDSVGSSIFYKWIKNVTINTLKDNLPGEIFGHAARTEVIYPLILNDKKLPIDIFDDTRTADVKETKDYILAKSINDAVDELRKQFGDDMSTWTWDKLHQITLGHRLGGEFNIGPEPADGGTDSVNVAGFDLTGSDFHFGGGPNMRMTTEMIPGRIRAKNVIAGGQSADPASPNFSDQFKMWLKKETHDMVFYDDEADAGAVKIITFNPAK